MISGAPHRVIYKWIPNCRLRHDKDMVWVDHQLSSESEESLQSTATTAVFIIYVAFKKASATAAPYHFNSNGQKENLHSDGISVLLSARDKSVLFTPPGNRGSSSDGFARAEATSAICSPPRVHRNNVTVKHNSQRSHPLPQSGSAVADIVRLYLPRDLPLDRNLLLWSAAFSTSDKPMIRLHPRIPMWQC